MITLSRYAVILVLSLVAFSSGVANELYKIDTAHSTIGFTVHQYLAVTKGRFKQFSGTIDIDREHPENSSVVAQIGVRSIDTGIKKRDDHLRSAEFFNVGQFPEITFKSQSVKRTAQQSGDIVGDITMHGVTKPITLHVKLMSPISEDTKQTRWSVTTEPLKRRDFGLMFSSATEAISGIGQEVAVNIEIVAARAR
jgi:polyisoprenoid-binding protein YceI